MPRRRGWWCCHGVPWCHGSLPRAHPNEFVNKGLHHHIWGRVVMWQVPAGNLPHEVLKQEVGFHMKCLGGVLKYYVWHCEGSVGTSCGKFPAGTCHITPAGNAWQKQGGLVDNPWSTHFLISTPPSRREREKERERER